MKKKSLNFGNYAHTVGTLIVDRGHKETWSYLSSALQPKLDYEVDWKISGWGNLEHRLFLIFLAVCAMKESKDERR